MFDITYSSVLQEQRFWITFKHARNDETQPTVMSLFSFTIELNLVVKSLIFHLVPLFFTLHEATELFIAGLCAFKGLMRDKTVKLNNFPVSCVMIQNTESSSDIEIRDNKQSKYPII